MLNPCKTAYEKTNAVRIRDCQLETATEPPMKDVNRTSTENPESDFRLIWLLFPTGIHRGFPHPDEVFKRKMPRERGSDLARPHYNLNTNGWCTITTMYPVYPSSFNAVSMSPYGTHVKGIQ